MKWTGELIDRAVALAEVIREDMHRETIEECYKVLCRACRDGDPAMRFFPGGALTGNWWHDTCIPIKDQIHGPGYIRCDARKLRDHFENKTK